MNKISRRLLLALAICGPFPVFAQHKAPDQSHKFLRNLDVKHGKSLAAAIRYGDAHISSLILALKDQDPDVRENAQRIIRYLDDSEGMQALISSYKKGENTIFTGPVPVPLSEWDFAYLEKNVLCAECNVRGPEMDYIYSLTMDRSLRAQEALAKIKLKIKAQVLFGDQFNLTVFKDENLAKDILERAFYLSPEDKKVATVRFIARTRDGQKSFYEVYVNHGALAEKWFHVALIKQSDTWRLLSVSLVAVS